MESLKILVVDDSPIIVRKLVLLLEDLGHDVVHTAATGAEAIVAYKQCKPDMVTMDITMPDMDGIQATRLLMQQYPYAKILMITSHGQEKMVLEALKAGARGYVLKPFQKERIQEAIQKACSRVVIKEKLQNEIEQRTADKQDRSPE